MSWMSTPPRERRPILSLQRVEQRDDLEPVVAEPAVVGERQAEVAGADDRDADAAVEPEDLPQVAPQLLDVVADAADAELAEIGQVLPDLRGVQVELLGQRLRGDGPDAARRRARSGSAGRPTADWWSARTPARSGRACRRRGPACSPGSQAKSIKPLARSRLAPRARCNIHRYGPHPADAAARKSGVSALRARQPVASGVHGQGRGARGAVRPDFRGLDRLPGPAGRAHGQRLDPDRGAGDLGAEEIRRLDDPRKQHRPDHRLGRRVGRRRRRLHHPGADLPRRPTGPASSAISRS